MTIKERVQALREKMKASGVAMYVVPSTDCHESEYVSEHFRARAFITGFTGASAGRMPATAEGLVPEWK